MGGSQQGWSNKNEDVKGELLRTTCPLKVTLGPMAGISGGYIKL